MKKKINKIFMLFITIFSIVICGINQNNVCAADSKVENAINWAIRIANDNSHGYSQSTRWGPHYDCSSFVYSAFYNAGFNLPKNSGYTQTMVRDFTNAGFSWITWDKIGNVNNLQRGDILLNNSNISSKQHTEIYLGNGQNVGAHSPSKGISVSGYYNHPWLGVLRYKSGPSINKLSGPINLGNSFSARIKNSGSSKYVSQIGNDVRLQSLGNDKLGTQIWKFNRNGDGSYTIKSSVKDKLCMDVYQALDTNGTNVQLYSNESHSNQKWFILKHSNGSYVLRPANSSSRVLDIDRGVWNEGQNIQLWEYSDLSSQTFWIEKCGNVENLGDEFKAIINNTKLWKPLWVQDSGNIVLGREERQSYDRILWHFYRNSETGAYVIYSYLNSKCLDVFDASDADGAKVQAYDQNGTTAQQWYIMSRDDGSLYLKAACSSKNLSLENFSGVDGTPINMSSNLNTEQQKFSIYKLDYSRDKSEYNIITSKNQININEKANITITDTHYVVSYKLYIIDPNGKETVIDNKCNPTYTFTGLKTGTYTIFAEIKSPVSTYIGSKTKKCVKITVVNPTVPVTSVSLNKTTLSLNKGSTTTLAAAVNPSNASNKTLTWTTSNTNIATVDSNGKVTAKGAGSATITVKTNNGKTATCKVTVTNPTVAVTIVSLNKTALSLVKGSSTTLSATVNPSNASNKILTWTTSNTNVATVDSNGKVTAKGAGNATITVKTNNGKTATCKVTVTNPIVAVTSVTLNKASFSLVKGSSTTLSATVNPSNASNKTLTWSTNNSSVATVDSNGKITANETGSATITVKTNNGKTATCKVTVTNPIVAVTSVTLNKASFSLVKGSSTTLSATVNPSNATNKTLTWTSSNSSIATVDQNGKITAINGGTAVISVKTSNGLIATCSVTIPYTITYNLNGGKNHNSNPNTYYGENMTLKNPKKKGYIFSGWYSDKKLKNKVMNFNNKDITLYARWTKVSVNKVKTPILTNINNQKLKITFEAINKAKGYQVEYSTNKHFNTSTIKTLKQRSITFKIKKGKTYYVRVRAYKLDSTGSKVYGKWSTIKVTKISK